jgi:hypothetical protein
VIVGRLEDKEKWGGGDGGWWCDLQSNPEEAGGEGPGTVIAPLEAEAVLGPLAGVMAGTVVDHDLR